MLEQHLAAGDSYAQIGRRYGLTKHSVYQRAKRFGLQAANPAQHPGSVFVEYQGERLNLHQLSLRTGVSYRALWNRYQKGHRGEALLRPVRKKKEVPKFYELGYTGAEWQELAEYARRVGKRTVSNRTGIPYGAISAAVDGRMEVLG